MGGESPIWNAASWPVVSLKDITTKIGSGATPRGGAETYLPSRTNYALIRSQNVFDRRFDHGGLAFISDEQAEGLRNAVVQPGDVLLNITGDGITFGRACLVPNDVRPACVNQHVSIVRVDSDLADAGFVLSFLTHPEIKPYIESFNAGGSRRAITKGHIESFRLPLPPLDEQRAIAHILGTLDNKIELNRRMNETLEAMARALFKSWFVDFDPVRARAQGQTPPGMDPVTAALFPCEFEDSELGEIPKGWRATTLGTEAQRCGGVVQTGPFGSQLHASDYVPEGIPVVMPKDIAGRRVSTDSIARIREADAERLSKHRLQPGDLVYSRRGDVERHALIENRERGWLCGTGCLLVRLGPAWPSPAFASLALDRPEARAWLSQHAVGATMPNLNTSILSAVPLVIPSDELLAVFNCEVDRLEQLHVTRDAESVTLGRLRDALLPRLLSGELSVALAERAAEATA